RAQRAGAGLGPEPQTPGESQAVPRTDRGAMGRRRRTPAGVRRRQEGRRAMTMLLLAVFLAVQTPVDSVALVTRDIPNFWRAYDLAAGKDSAQRTRIFRTAYLQPRPPGLRDWMRVRPTNRDTVPARMIAPGWHTARSDS